MSTKKVKQGLRRLERRHGALLEDALKLDPMLRGSFSRVHTRCGRANCWCAKSAKGHRHERVTWSRDGRLTTRKVPPGQAERVVALTDNHRKFRVLRRQLVALNGEMLKALDRFEKESTSQSRKPLGLLDPEPDMKAKPTKRRHTGSEPRKVEL